jgi:hypothetical protein
MLLRRRNTGPRPTPGTLAPPQPVCRQCLLRARNHLEDAREPGTARQTRYATEWMVVNEPHGLRDHAGHRNRQRSEPGHRHRHPSRSPEEPWTLCVVRWIRTETPEQVELGLQVLANTAKPFRSVSATPRTSAHAPGAGIAANRRARTPAGDPCPPEPIPLDASCWFPTPSVCISPRAPAQP